MSKRVLVVDDEQELRSVFSRYLEQAGFEVESAEDGEQALTVLERGSTDLMLLDIEMPKLSGLDVLGQMRQRGLSTPALVVSGVGNIEVAVQAVKLGAFDFVQKPVHRERLLLTVRNALQFDRLQAVQERQQADAVSGDIIGQGAAMQRLKALIEKVARAEGRVLITGENGTGKELVAAAIHAGSARSRGPFVRLNCGAVAKDLVESELFGHEKGSFTGAISTRKGRFELADGGTLLLDEVGDMPLPMQVKLLRVLQEGQVERVGASRSIGVDVRVLAATNRDLAQMVREGAFREDLYYRLNVVTLTVPALRERREDIPALLAHFTRRGAPAAGLSFTEDAVQALQKHDYPGNVRELQNLVERLSMFHAGERIDGARAREVLRMGGGSTRTEAEAAPAYEVGKSMRELHRDFERRVMIEAIALHGNSKSAAAEALGSDKSHFYKKCRELGIGGPVDD